MSLLVSPHTISLKRFLIIFILGICFCQLSAQSDTTGTIPAQRLGLDFTFGINSLVPKGQSTGLTMGFGTTFYVTPKISISPQLLYSLLSYRLYNDVYVETSDLEIPVHVTIKPFQWKFAPFVSLGTSCKVDMVSASSHWFAEGAIGVQKNFDYGAIAPEIRYSLGKDMQVIYLLLNFRF